MRPRDNPAYPRAAARKRWAARLFGLAMFGLLSIMFLFQLRQDRIASLSAATATAEFRSWLTTSMQAQLLEPPDNTADR